ncbi:hypothetical protein Tco_1230850, partial [Tanacetum coccineum]
MSTSLIRVIHNFNRTIELQDQEEMEGQDEKEKKDLEDEELKLR